MAFPTAVNGQITDAVTQANVKVTGEVPAMEIGSLYQTLSNNVATAKQQTDTPPPPPARTP